ncbi:hypothetical protein BBJ28_00008204 [Nothophytophthora sp. Chile5]|nr:hypothetical protein BBJ28_00008204 [Nothophytophthora sp. Chile5]
MAIVSPTVTPHYIAILEGSPVLHPESSLPMLVPGEDSPGPLEVDDLRNSDSSVDKRSAEALRGDYLLSYLRPSPHWWLILRWQLSRNVLTLAFPLMTGDWNVSLSDLAITLPLTAILVAAGTLLAIQFNVAGSGIPSAVGLAFVCICAVRKDSLLLLLTKIPLRYARFYHRLFALASVYIAGLHGWVHVISRPRGEINYADFKVMTGLVAFGGLLVACVLSFVGTKRRLFDFFARVQWVVLAVVVTFATFHGAFLAAMGIVPWVIEVLLRLNHHCQGPLSKTATKRTAPDSRTGTGGVDRKFESLVPRDRLSISQLSGNILLIEFPRVRVDTGEAFDYNAGQHALLCIPMISSLEWHPFTMSSSPDEDLVTFHIKVLGQWTGRLSEIVSATSLEDKAPCDLLVDGPYGGISVDIYSPEVYSHIVLLSGGIGVTPMRSIANWLYYECYGRERKEIESVHCVWPVKDLATVEAMVATRDALSQSQKSRGDSILSLADSRGIPTRSTNLFRFEFYVTNDSPDVAVHLDPQIRECLRYGSRPDSVAVLREMGERAVRSGKLRVAVLVSGPTSMVADVLTP